MKRHLEVDFLKVFGIIAVVIGHTSCPFNSFIFSWHMPLFFFLSGLTFTLEDNKWQSFKKDSKRLLIPFVIFSALGLVVELSKRLLLARPLDDALDVLSGTYLFIDSSVHSYGFVLWFLPALWVAKQLLHLFYRQESISWALTLHLLSYLSFTIDASILEKMPFAIGQSLFAVNFLSLGLIIRLLQFRQNRQSLFIVAAMMSGYFGLFVYLNYHLPKVDLGGLVFNGKGLAFLWPMAVCVSLYILSLLCFSGKESKKLSLFASLTMVIFVFHPYTNNMAYILTQKLLPQLGWYGVCTFSFIFLIPLFYLKIKFNNRSIFKYV